MKQSIQKSKITEDSLVLKEYIKEIIDTYDRELYIGAVCLSSVGLIKITNIYKKNKKIHDSHSDKYKMIPTLFIEYVSEENQCSDETTEEFIERMVKEKAEYDKVHEVWWEARKVSETVDEFIRYRDKVLNKPYPQLVDEIYKGILTDEPKEEIRQSDSTAVGFRLGKEEALNVKLSIIRKINDMEVRQAILRDMMETKRSELYRIMETFKKQLKKVKRAIDTIELYLGVNEEVIQIQEGEKADINTPISIRQQILFMDEEVGALGDKEISYKNIEEFDNWVIQNKNYKKLIPEERGVVSLMPKRYTPKMEGENKWIRSREETANKETYLLIRNGDNLYRIYTSIIVHPRLFPLQNEMQDMVKRIEEADWKSDKEKIEDDIFIYRRNIIILQGIIERTEIFTPLPFSGLNLLNPDSYGDFIVFIRDDELSLPDIKPPYREWKKEINKSIKRGSRVYISQQFRTSERYVSARDYIDRFLLPQLSDYNIPPLPEPGIYTVEEVVTTKLEYIRDKKGNRIENTPGWKQRGEDYYKRERVETGKHLVIKYNPGDTVYNVGWSYEPHTRKKKISFVINKDDFFVFNYDKVDLESVEFYIHSRVNREEYASILPILYGVRDMRLREIEWENHFVNLVINEVKKVNNIVDTVFDIDIELVIRESIEWWKRKVIWKRPITKDDAKALRMIRSRVKRMLEGKLR